nr:putative mitochondrial protein [Tanacetum cinerariifolium]
MHWLSGKQLTKHVTQKTANLSLEELLKEFDDVFALPTVLPPQRHHDHRIPLKEGATPINIRPYKHPPSQKDVISLCANVTDHLLHLRSILTIMRATSLYAKSKYVFGTPQVEYLGHVISEGGVATNPAKIIAMKEWPIPTSLKQLRATQAFEALKIAMTKAPVLKLRDFDAPFMVETDASGIAYEKELLAVIMALERWRGYLLDRHFQIKTYHFSLKKGKDNQAADALSRTTHGRELSTMLVTSIFSGLIEELKKSCEQDSQLQILNAKSGSENVKCLPSPNYHPQTDGQTEAVNKTLECYLRCMTGEKPKEWTHCWEVQGGAVDRTLVARDQAIQLLQFYLKRAQDRMKSMADKHRSASQLRPLWEAFLIAEMMDSLLIDVSLIAVLDRRMIKRKNRVAVQFLI